MFKKIIDWFKKSNRWKHFVGGIGIGLFSNDLYCAAYCGIGVASALEFKDKQGGGSWDWIDWTLTIIGVSIGFLIRLGIITLF